MLILFKSHRTKMKCSSPQARIYPVGSFSDSLCLSTYGGSLLHRPAYFC